MRFVLGAQNICATRPATELSERQCGPFWIESVVRKSAHLLSFPFELAGNPSGFPHLPPQTGPPISLAITTQGPTRTS